MSTNENILDSMEENIIFSKNERFDDFHSATIIIQKSIESDIQSEKLDALYKLLLLSKTPPKDSIPPINMIKCIRLLLCDKDKKIRYQAIRSLRYIARSPEILHDIVRLNIPIFISRSLERQSASYLSERIQALKFIRHFIRIDASQIPRTIVQSLIAIAQDEDDGFRIVCLDTIRELAVINTEIVASCNCVKVLIDAILNPKCKVLSSTLTVSLLYILDKDSSRRYVRPSLDIQRLLSIFTDTDSTDSDDQHLQRDAARKVLHMMMKSQTGILYLSSDEYGLKSLVKILSLPQNVKGASYARDSMFDLFFEILDFAKTSDSSNAYSLNFGPNLLFNYIVTVLICFIENGLIKALVTIGMSNDKHSAFAAKSLLNEILKLSAGFLPVSICHELNMLTSVVINATKYSDTISTKQINASSMIVELSNGITAKSGESILQTSAFRMHRKHSEDSFIHVEILAAQTDTNSNFIRYRYNSQTRKNSLQIRYHIRPHHAHSICSRGKETSLKESLYHSLRSREHNMSEDQLQILLKKTNIINSKEFLTWDWDLCWNLLEGPFWNISLFRIVLKTKFVKRLLSFLTPSGRFCRLLQNVENMKYVRVVCQLFRVLTSSDEGCDNYQFSDLISNIFDMIKSQIHRNNGAKEESEETDFYPLSRYNIEQTLSREYFTLIGIVSESEVGLRYFECYHMYKFIIDIKSPQQSLKFIGQNDYFIRIFATHLDYSFAESSRNLLNHLLTYGSISLKQYLISHLRLLFRAKVNNFEKWGIKLLAAQMKSVPAVTIAAIDVLEEVCNSNEENIHELIKNNPDFTSVWHKATNIFLRLLTYPDGVNYLSKIGWIKSQLEYYCNGNGNLQYSSQIENSLINSLDDGRLIRLQPNKNLTPKNNQYIRASIHSMSISGSERKYNSSDNDEKSQSIKTELKPFIERTQEEDFYYERLQNLPQSISIIINNQKASSKTDVLSETFLCYNSQSTITKEDSFGKSFGCVVIACIIDKYGSLKSCEIEPDDDIKAKLSIGDGCLDDTFGNRQLEQTCTASDRRALTVESCFIESNSCIWEFELISVCRLETKLHHASETITTHLSSVSFKIMLPKPSFSYSLVVQPSPHFFGQLAKTKEGSKIIKDSGHLDNFIEIIKSSPLFDEKRSESDNKFSSNKDYKLNTIEALDASLKHDARIRSILWAVGMIGSSDNGYKLLSSTDIIEYISIIAFESSCLSMRGTCFYIIGMMSRSDSCREHLRKLGWGFPLNTNLGIAVPNDVKKFLKVLTSKYIGLWSFSENNRIGVNCSSFIIKSKIKTDISETTKELSPEIDYSDNLSFSTISDRSDSRSHLLEDRQKIILMHISCLSNNVTQKESYDSLIKLCANNPDIFGSTAFLFEALKLLSVYSFKLSTRRFILFELFGSVTFTSKNIEMFDSDMTISLDNIPKHLPIPSKWAESKQNPLSTPGSKSLLKIPDTPSIGGSPETNKQLTSNRSSGNNDFVID